MPSQLVIFLLLFGGVQGLLFSLFLFRKKLYRSGYVFLLLYIGIILLQLTLKVMNKLWLMENWGLLYSLSHFLPLLYGPLAWLFVKNLVERRRFTSNILFHFLPYFFILLLTALGEYEMIPSTLENILYNSHIRLALLSGSLITYHMLAFRTWHQRKILQQNYFTEASRFQMNWLRSFVLLSFIAAAWL